MVGFLLVEWGSTDKNAEFFFSMGYSCLPLESTLDTLSNYID